MFRRSPATWSSIGVGELSGALNSVKPIVSVNLFVVKPQVTGADSSSPKTCMPRMSPAWTGRLIGKVLTAPGTSVRSSRPTTVYEPGVTRNTLTASF